MSFFKKLTTEIKDLIGDKDDKTKHDTVQGPDNTRDYNHPAQPYPQQAHGSANQYAAPNWSPSQPQLPPGWISQWDPNSQRWYFLEQSSGRTQWEPPQPNYNVAPPPPQTHDQGYHAHGSHAYPAAHQYQPHDSTKDMHSHDKEKHKSGKGGMIAAGAGGLAVGALAGAALAGDSSDDEHGHSYATGPPGYYGGSAAPPVPLEHNPELSSSQRSSLEEARQDYEEAQREVAEDSDPSSSDVEDLQEAREEYHSEVESAHEELEE